MSNSIKSILNSSILVLFSLNFMACGMENWEADLWEKISNKGFMKLKDSSIPYNCAAKRIGFINSKDVSKEKKRFTEQYHFFIGVNNPEEKCVRDLVGIMKGQGFEKMSSDERLSALIVQRILCKYVGSNLHKGSGEQLPTFYLPVQGKKEAIAVAAVLTTFKNDEWKPGSVNEATPFFEMVHEPLNLRSQHLTLDQYTRLVNGDIDDLGVSDSGVVFGTDGYLESKIYKEYALGKIAKRIDLQNEVLDGAKCIVTKKKKF